MQLTKYEGAPHWKAEHKESSYRHLKEFVEGHKFRTAMAGSKNYWDYMVKVINATDSLQGYPCHTDTDYKIELTKTFGKILSETKWPEDEAEWIKIPLKLSKGAMMQLRYLFDFLYISKEEDTDEYLNDVCRYDTVVIIKGPIEHNWDHKLPSIMQILKLDVMSLSEFLAARTYVDKALINEKKTLQKVLSSEILCSIHRHYHLLDLYFDKYRCRLVEEIYLALREFDSMKFSDKDYM